MIRDFFAQIEPLLKEAGYKGKITSSDGLSIWKGQTSVIIHHHPHPYNQADERVCLSFTLKNKQMKSAHPAMVLWLVDHLSYQFPEFNFTCLKNHAIFARYVCDICEPQDILSQLTYAVEFFGHVRHDYRKLLPDVCKEITDDQ